MGKQNKKYRIMATNAKADEAMAKAQKLAETFNSVGIKAVVTTYKPEWDKRIVEGNIPETITEVNLPEQNGGDGYQFWFDNETGEFLW